MAWNLSTPDWQNRIRTGQSLIPDLPLLDKAAAERAVNLFDRLRLPDVTGKATIKGRCWRLVPGYRSGASRVDCERREDGP
jgi:hypothetical protein